MSKKDLKALAERFRLLAEDGVGIDELADETCAAHPQDLEVCELAARFKAAIDAAAVHAIADEVKGRP